MTTSAEVHFEGKIAQKAIIVKEGKVLIMRDPREATVVWEIPGGRMNIDEEPREALRRELFEEMGIDCDIHEVIFMSQFLQGNEGKRAFVIVYRATLRDEKQHFTLDAREVCETRWIGEDEIDGLTFFPEYEKALTQFFKSGNT